jgi:hypothetical protein
MDFNKDNALSIEDVHNKYKYSSHELFDTYNQSSGSEDHPYIDDVLELYEDKKQKMMDKRKQRLLDATKPTVVANMNDMRRGAIVERLRSKVANRKNFINSI